MKKRNLIIASIVAGTIGLAGISYASDYRGDREHCEYKGGHHRGHHDGHNKGMKYMMKELDLTSEQKKIFREIKKENREQMLANRDKMKELRKELHKLSTAEKYDASKVRELADKKASLMSDMIVKRAESMQKLRKELTPDQIEELEELNEDYHDRD